MISVGEIYDSGFSVVACQKLSQSGECVLTTIGATSIAMKTIKWQQIISVSFVIASSTLFSHVPMVSGFLFLVNVNMLKHGLESRPWTLAAGSSDIGEIGPNFSLLVDAGVAYAEQKEYSLAKLRIEQALIVAETQHNVTPSMKANALCPLGTILVQQGETQSAKRVFEAAFLVDPGLGSVADVHHKMASALKSANMTDLALAEYRAAIKSEPWMPEPHGHLADLLRILNDDEEAELEYRIAANLCRSIASEPSLNMTAETFKRYKLVLLPEYLSELEALLLKKNNFSDEATKAHREAVSVAPDEAPILTMFGQSLLSSGYEEGTNYMALAEAAKIREEARSHGQHSHIPPVQPTKKEN